MIDEFETTSSQAKAMYVVYDFSHTFRGPLLVKRWKEEHEDNMISALIRRHMKKNADHDEHLVCIKIRDISMNDMLLDFHNFNDEFYWLKNIVSTLRLHKFKVIL